MTKRSCTGMGLRGERGLRSTGDATLIDWKKVPKQALIDALRNSSLGPSNLSAQDKPDLIAIAMQGLASDKRETLLQHLETEVTFRASADRWAACISA